MSNQPVDPLLGERFGFHRAVEKLRGGDAYELLVNHALASVGGCTCGWSSPDSSHLRHVVDVLVDWLTVEATKIYGGDRCELPDSVPVSRADEHECDPPFWRTRDEQWVCRCGKRYVWHTELGTVPGVPAAVCTVRTNTWVEAPPGGGES